MAKTITSDLPIIIVGGGPAGLALAQGLRKRQIPYRVFERDENSSVKSQGWAVAIQQSKLPFLNNLPNDMPPLDKVSHLYDLGLKASINSYDGTTGKLLFGREEGDDFFRADRLKLRDWLLHNIDVEWNKRFDHYVEDDSGVTVHFKDGTSARGCALVGAEGYQSKVRHQLWPGDADAGPSNFDTILGVLTVSREKSDQYFKDIARSVGAIQLPDVFLFVGFHETSDDGQQAKWYWMAFHPRTEEEAGREIKEWSSEKLYELAGEWLRDLDPKFKDMIEETPRGNCEVMPEFSYRWRTPKEGFSTERVTLVGDAAHKMPPLGGQGVNNAFYDTIELCEALDSEETLAKALKKYDGKVAVRGRQAVENSLKWPVVDVGK